MIRIRPGDSLITTALTLLVGTLSLRAQVSSTDPTDAITAESAHVAYVKHLIQEPRITARLPGLECVSEIAKSWRGYGIPGAHSVGTALTLNGETVTIKLKQGQNTLAEASWSTEFPSRAYGSGERFLPAKVSGEDLLIKLFRLGVFTSEDLAELVHSRTREVRIAAAANLTDQSLLSEVAFGDNDLAVRKAAVAKLGDQSALLRLAMEDKNSSIRVAAAERLTDQAALAKVVVEHREFVVRVTAVNNLTDQSLLAKIATQDQEPMIRRAAVERLTDQSALSKVAVEEKNVSVRFAAIAKLTDESVLARLAADDADQDVRKAAGYRLSSVRKR